jgi:hypothetical protein
MRSVRRSLGARNIDMQTLNDKGLFKNFMMDKLEESSAQDKLNLMIIRGQDPS